MSDRLYSVEQVADLLGLHVKTVRRYVHDGRLKAVRIGKQYRIAHESLEELTGHQVSQPAAQTARRQRSVEVSSVVQIDAIDRESMIRVTNTLVAAANSSDPSDRLRVESIYDEERASLKIIVLGGPGPVADLIRLLEPLGVL